MLVEENEIESDSDIAEAEFNGVSRNAVPAALQR